MTGHLGQVKQKTQSFSLDSLVEGKKASSYWNVCVWRWGEQRLGWICKSTLEGRILLDSLACVMPLSVCGLYIFTLVACVYEKCWAFPRVHLHPSSVREEQTLMHNWAVATIYSSPQEPAGVTWWGTLSLRIISPKPATSSLIVRKQNTAEQHLQDSLLSF